jgi:CRP-like cAMP-binding protein
VFLLKQASIFKGLHVEDLEVLAAFAGQQELEVGRAFVQQGERLDRLAVVSQGKLVNCRRSNGQLEPVESIGPGSCLGGTCLSGGEPSRFTMLAHSYTKLLTLERPALERAMALRPAIRRALNGTT